MRQQTGKVTAQLKLKTLNDNPYLSAKEQASYAQQSYELTSESFQVGKKNTVELITAENSMTSAKQQVLQSKYMTLMNLSLLDIYQGKYEIDNK